LAVLTPLDDADARDLCAAFGLPPPPEVHAIEGIAGGSVNSNFALFTAVPRGRVFCRLYEEQDLQGARREAAMLSRLAAAGVPTPAPLRLASGASSVLRTPELAFGGGSGEFIHQVRGKPAALFPWCDGGIRCQAGVTPDDAARVGEALARVHAAGQAEAAGPGRFGLSPLLARLDRIESSRDPRFAPVVPGLRAHLQRVHAARDPQLPSGLTHGDLFRDNVLWKGHGGPDLAALLDFESACLDSYAYDLSVTVLSWCFGGDLDPRLCSAMRRGYEQVRPLTAAERVGLHAEAEFAALRFTITRITDYAMRTTATGPRVIKDWTRFMKRFEKLEALGAEGFQALMFG
jgi:homoserine kinase type II